jgi:hypothetical protein
MPMLYPAGFSTLDKSVEHTPISLGQLYQLDDQWLSPTMGHILLAHG